MQQGPTGTADGCVFCAGCTMPNVKLSTWVAVLSRQLMLKQCIMNDLCVTMAGWNQFKKIKNKNKNCIVSSFKITKTLTLLGHAGLFCFFHSPPNSDVDYRIFKLVLWCFLYCVQLQHYKDSDTFSACWIILFFP